ncbi:transaldolase [Pricia antarctica]|uniref:Transaldolase n=1 Tax=Pricia antarctica TaxID=641691 RepID=A0A1G7D6J9_9FLAO|nr:transaldolase [Pricia antarctica]SDE46620.1 transaldolase [Pricia antarctica]
MNPLLEVLQQGQSIWLDLLDRKMMDSGKLRSWIDDDGLRGITSNPAIFEKAISNSSDYDEDIASLAKNENNNEAIFFGLAVKDIQRATDIFQPIYEETEGLDGYVSLEVSPFLARDTNGTIAQARELWKKVDRKNVMIKIPGTKEGLPAIRKCISEGININVTLLFGIPRYKEVTEAFISGLEDRLDAGKSIDGIASVASFFLSRIDVMVDPMLEEKGLKDLKGEVAIASAKKAYQIYQEVFSRDRFKKLRKKGAKPQRVLWASTSVKDPSFRDVKYVEALIGPETVNTLPLDTLEAFRDHGKVANELTENTDHSDKVLHQLKEKGINIDKVTQDLEDEGIEKFNTPFDKLLKGIEAQKQKAVS